MGTVLYLVLLLALTVGLVMFLETRNKPSPDIVTCTMKPGKTTLRMVDDDGTVRLVLVLRLLTVSHDGPATAEFADLTHWMRNQVYVRGDRQ